MLSTILSPSLAYKIMKINHNISSNNSLPFSISLLPSTSSMSMIPSSIAPIQRSSSVTSSTSIDSSNSSKKRQRSSSICSPSSEHDNGDVMTQLQNIHPKDYVKSAFAANGYDVVKQVEITTHCIERFQTPTSAQLEQYSTDILLAVRNNDLPKAKSLYEEGKFNSNACNRFGESILHIACRRGHLAMVQFFIEEVGMKVHEIRDDYHRTPLHDAFWTSKASPQVIAYLFKQPNVIELLLLQDKRGYTPLDYARSEDRSKWLYFLWERKHLLVPTIKMNNKIDELIVLESPSACEKVDTPSTKRQKLFIIG